MAQLVIILFCLSVSIRFSFSLLEQTLNHYYRGERERRPHTIKINLQTELQLVLFFNLEHFNYTSLAEILLQCAVFPVLR